MITATAAHVPVLAALHGAVFPDDPWDEKAFTDLIKQPGMVGMIDPRGGFLLIWVVADEASIITIGVVPKRQGIGKALLTAGLANIRAQGVATVYLEVAAGNTGARGLYESFGFTQAGLRQKYYINGEDALLLRLSLSG